MRLVDDEKCFVALGDGLQFLERSKVAVHAVEALYSDPWSSFSTARAPACDRVLECLGVIMICSDFFCEAKPHAIMHAGVDQRVVNDQITAIGQGREDRPIGRETIGEIERGVAAEETRCLRLQQLMFGIIAAQEPRSACANGDPSIERRGYDVPEFLRAREAEIIIGGKIPSRARDQHAQPVPRSKLVEPRTMLIENGHACVTIRFL